MCLLSVADWHKAVQGVYGAGLLLVIVALLIGLVQMLCCCCCKESSSGTSAVGSLTLSGGKHPFHRVLPPVKVRDVIPAVFRNLGVVNVLYRCCSWITLCSLLRRKNVKLLINATDV